MVDRFNPLKETRITIRKQTAVIYLEIQIEIYNYLHAYGMELKDLFHHLLVQRSEFETKNLPDSQMVWFNS